MYITYTSHVVYNNKRAKYFVNMFPSGYFNFGGMSLVEIE